MTLSTDTLTMPLFSGLRRSALLLGLALSVPALAQESGGPSGTTAPDQRGPSLRDAGPGRNFELDGDYTVVIDPDFSDLADSTWRLIGADGVAEIPEGCANETCPFSVGKPISFQFESPSA